jgi:predicted phage terminase large subunit-like protein
MKAEWPEVRKTIATALAEPGVQLGIESAMHRLAAVQGLLRMPELANITLKSIRVDEDKISRALPIASRAGQGKVKLVRGSWISDFLDEATAFPHGAHDDQVDGFSGAFQMISLKKTVWCVY